MHVQLVPSQREAPHEAGPPVDDRSVVMTTPYGSSLLASARTSLVGIGPASGAHTPRYSVCSVALPTVRAANKLPRCHSRPNVDVADGVPSTADHAAPSQRARPPCTLTPPATAKKPATSRPPS